LAFGRLPAAKLPETFRLPAVALVPRPRQKHATTALPVTSPQRKPVGARRGRRGGDKLLLSQGRWYSRWGRPRGWPSALRAPFRLLDAPPAVPFRRQLVQYTRNAFAPSGAAIPQGPWSSSRRFPPRAAGVNKQGEGNEEGDGLELARSWKDTHLPRKPTPEERNGEGSRCAQGDNEVHRSAGPQCDARAGLHRGGPRAASIQPDPSPSTSTIRLWTPLAGRHDGRRSAARRYPFRL
jgi:hypothetical protein